MMPTNSAREGNRIAVTEIHFSFLSNWACVTCWRFRRERAAVRSVVQGGHVIDARITCAVRDVAIARGKIAALAEKIDPAKLQRVNVAGLY